MRRAALVLLILALEFAALEAGLRTFGSSEASPGFQSLFMDDPVIGHRLRPGAHTRFTTPEFSTDLAINAQGVRDDADIGPKAPNERRVVVLGDSMVLSVQVSLAATFCKQLEGKLNAWDPAHHWRVINAGVQGFGPVEEWLFYHHIAESFQADLVLLAVTVGNDAQEAYGDEAVLAADRQLGGPPSRPSTWARRLVRSSMVLQIVGVRYEQLRARLTTPTMELPLTIYLADEPTFVKQGLSVAAQATRLITDRATALGARMGIVLVPARFQVEDGDYGRLAEIVQHAGGTLVRNAATDRFRDALAPIGVPILDLQPALAAQPDHLGLFFERNVHLTPRGHAVVADALMQFVEAQGLVAR